MKNYMVCGPTFGYTCRYDIAFAEARREHRSAFHIPFIDFRKKLDRTGIGHRHVSNVVLRLPAPAIPDSGKSEAGIE